MNEIEKAGQDIVDGIPKSFQQRYKKRAMEAPNSYPSAILMKCLDCCAWEYGEVKECHMVACPLHMLRGRLVDRAAKKQANVPRTPHKKSERSA